MEICENTDPEVEVLFFFFQKFRCVGVHFVSNVRTGEYDGN